MFGFSLLLRYIIAVKAKKYKKETEKEKTPGYPVSLTDYCAARQNFELSALSQ